MIEGLGTTPTSQVARISHGHVDSQMTSLPLIASLHSINSVIRFPPGKVDVSEDGVSGPNRLISDRILDQEVEADRLTLSQQDEEAREEALR